MRRVLWLLVNEIFRIMFSNKVLGIKEAVSFQGHFIYWECLNLEIHSIDNTAGLKLAASDSAQIWLSASTQSTKSLSSS